MSTYSGTFDSKDWYQVFKDGQPFSAAESLKVRNHSPDGFAWSYTGSGPSQLALAILLDVSDRETAERLYMEYKNAVIANLPQDDPWSLTSEQVLSWVQENL